MRAALRGDGFRGIGRAAAEVVFAIGADAEVGGVAIDADLRAGLEGMAAGGVGDVLAAVEEVAVGLHHRAAGGVEGFVRDRR